MSLIDNDVNWRYRTWSVRTENAVTVDGSIRRKSNLIVPRGSRQDLNLIVDSCNALDMLYRVFGIRLQRRAGDLVSRSKPTLTNVLEENRKFPKSADCLVWANLFGGKCFVALRWASPESQTVRIPCRCPPVISAFSWLPTNNTSSLPSRISPTQNRRIRAQVFDISPPPM